MVLTIDRNTFLWHEGERGLAYNSSNNKYFIFEVSREIKKALVTLDMPENLYMVEIPDNFDKDEKLNEWIQNLFRIGSGRIFTNMDSAEASLKPIVKILYDREKLLSNGDYIGMLSSVREITVHLNGASLHQEDNKLFQQYFHPMISDRSLGYMDVLSFISRFPNTVSINFIGDFSKYSHLPELIKRLEDRMSYITFYSRIEDLALVEEKKRNILNSCNLVVLCNGNPKNKEYLSLIESSFENKRVDYLCSSEEDISFVESIELKKNIIKIIPFYNGNNIEFLRKYVFLNEDEIFQQKLDKRKIFINQTLNGFFYGKILVLPDGSVKANANTTRLGDIHDSLCELLNSLFNKESTWFRTRVYGPCDNCIYQWLCPPVSNYELITGCGFFCNVNHVETVNSSSCL